MILTLDLTESSDEIEELKILLNEKIELPDFKSLCLCQRANEMKKYVNFYKRQLRMRRGELETLKEKADKLKDGNLLTFTCFQYLNDYTQQNWECLRQSSTHSATLYRKLR